MADTSPAPAIRLATPAEVDAIAAVLARAFDDDPVYNWIARQDAHRADAIREWFRWELEHLALPRGEVYVRGALDAAAIWFPSDLSLGGPGAQIRYWAMLGRVAGWRRLPLMLRGFRLFDAEAPPAPYHYLSVIGVDPVSQGNGHGAALVQHVARRCDAQGIPIYLESSKESNIAFYEGRGFEQIGRFTLPDGPPLWKMWRPPSP